MKSKNISQKIENMSKIKKFNLINSTFSAQDAKNMLFDFINSKIRYHNMEIFSTYERFGIEPSHSVKRIKELKQDLKKLEEFIKEAEEENMLLEIESVLVVKKTK